MAGILSEPSVLQYLQLVFAVEMITEAPGEFSQARALVFPLIIVETDVQPGLQGLPGVFELPLHQLLGSHRGSVLLQPSQHRVRGLGLDSVEHCCGEGTGWLTVLCCVVTL